MISAVPGGAAGWPSGADMRLSLRAFSLVAVGAALPVLRLKQDSNLLNFLPRSASSRTPQWATPASSPTQRNTALCLQNQQARGIPFFQGRANCAVAVPAQARG